MDNYFKICHSVIVGAEFIAALTAVVYFSKLKKVVWKVFAIYLVYIFLQELNFYFNESLFSIGKKQYINFIGIPIEYIFLYWVFAYHSLKNQKLFFLFSIVYLVSLLSESYWELEGVVKSFSYTIGILLLSFLLIMEFMKQIKSDEILHFKKNKMFYITIGVILGYIGSFTFFTFNSVLHTNHLELWYGFHVFFISMNTIMYLLFAASFIWGKRQ